MLVKSAKLNFQHSIWHKTVFLVWFFFSCRYNTEPQFHIEWLKQSLHS